MEDETTTVMESPETQTDETESPYFDQDDYQKATGEEPEEPNNKKNDTQPDEEEQKKPSQEEQQAPDDNPPALNAGLLSIAHRVGLTEEEALSFGNEEALIKGIQLLQNHLSDGHDYEEAQEEAQDEGLNFEPFTVPDDIKEMLDEPMNEFFVSMNSHYQNQLNTALESMDVMNAQLQDMALQHWDERLNVQFESLGDEFNNVFGEGQTWDLAQDSEHLKARIEVMDRMEKLSADPSLNLGQLFKQSVDSLHADTQTKADRSKLSNQLKKGRGRLTERPSQRRTKDGRDNRQRALDRITMEMAEQGLEY